MLEQLFIDGYLDVYKMILDYQTDLDLSPNDVLVLFKILDCIKKDKKIRITKIAQDINVSKQCVESALENLISKKIYGTIITTNEYGMPDERPTIKPLFDKIEDLVKSSQIKKVKAELQNIVSLYESGINKPISIMEYSKLEGFISEGFLVDEIKDAIKAAIKKGNVNMSFVERTIIKNHRSVLEQKNEEEKKPSELAKALAKLN